MDGWLSSFISSPILWLYWMLRQCWEHGCESFGYFHAFLVRLSEWEFLWTAHVCPCHPVLQKNDPRRDSLQIDRTLRCRAVCCHSQAQQAWDKWGPAGWRSLAGHTGAAVFRHLVPSEDCVPLYMQMKPKYPSVPRNYRPAKTLLRWTVLRMSRTNQGLQDIN